MSFRIGTDADPPRFKMKGWGNAFATVGEIRSYNGTIVDAHLFRGKQGTGEIAAFDIWPVAGVEVGILGARVRLFNLEAGAGTLLYEPRPSSEGTADTRTKVPD